MPPVLNRQIDEVDLTLANGTVDLLLDFAQCNFISVDGVEWLEELLLRAESLSAKVGLKNVSPSIYKVFKVARIDSILKACRLEAPSGSPP
jgi:anti-anti-sigma regulatory factor